MKAEKVYFKNRDDAAKQLIGILPIEEMKLEEWIVFSTSSCGYGIAQKVAKALNASADYMFCAKIYTPNNNECEIAIVTESQEVVIHEELAKAFNISLDFVYDESKIMHEKLLKNKVFKFRGEQQVLNVENKNVLLVDEGLNTSLTMMACIKTAINLKAKSVSVALPIIPEASIQVIESIADDLYYKKSIAHFINIKHYYEELNDIKFIDILNKQK